MQQGQENLQNEKSDGDKSPSATILFVDDESNILASLNRLFRPQGYRILTAESAAKGLAILEQEPVDVVVSDMRMPEMDGSVFLEKVAQKWPETTRILLTGHSDFASTIAAINKGSIYRYISKPWEDNDLRLTIQHALEQKFLKQERARLEKLTTKQNELLKQLNANLENKVKARTAELGQAMAQLEITYESLKTSYSSAVKVFASLTEIREGSLSGHSRRVADNARLLAGKLALSEFDTENIVHAALLHDIGKIGLPDSLINQPFNSLSKDDRIKVTKHPVIAQAILIALEPLQEAATLIRSLHERHDGLGYPDGLKGEKTPLGARILAVVNDYDNLLRGALLVDRLSPAQAVTFLQENRGKRYDPLVVDAFIAVLTTSQLGEQKRAEAPVKSGGLKSGMVLARDLIVKGNILVLSRDCVLDDGTISKLQKFESTLDADFTLYVYADRR